MEHDYNFPKIWKNKFYHKIAKAGVSEIFITIPLTLETMQQLILKPWRRFLGPWCRKNNKIQKLEKIQNIF